MLTEAEAKIWRHGYHTAVAHELNPCEKCGDAEAPKTSAGECMTCGVESATPHVMHSPADVFGASASPHFSHGFSSCATAVWYPWRQIFASASVSITTPRYRELLGSEE